MEKLLFCTHKKKHAGPSLVSARTQEMRKKKAKVKLDPAVAKKVADRSQTKLDLKGYRLQDVHMPIIDMAQFQSLVWLNLPSNQLTELPIGICSIPTLKTLRLSSNYLSSLPPQISALSNLTSLDLAKNDFKVLGPEIGTLTNIIDLNLHWNGLCNVCFTTFPDITAQVCTELNSLVKLKTFNVSLNCLGNITPFASCIKIENLDISHNRSWFLPKPPNSF
jgi:Leucine-rich repeat (LRR) protein